MPLNSALRTHIRTHYTRYENAQERIDKADGLLFLQAEAILFHARTQKLLIIDTYTAMKFPIHEDFKSRSCGI